MDIVTISNEAAWRAILNYYFNCVCDVSRHVGSVIHALEQGGLSDNTIIVYTADHGEAAGAHRMKEKIGTIYKEMMHVPLVMVHPDPSGGRTTEALSSTVDIVPTLLAFAGVPPDEVASNQPQLKGYNLSPVMPIPRHGRVAISPEFCATMCRLTLERAGFQARRRIRQTAFRTRSMAHLSRRA